MHLDKIDYFLNAAEMRNFTKAAEACHISQTAISKHIRQLEEELGCELFEREGRKLSLTREGQVFYDGMKDIQERYMRLLEEMKTGSGDLRLGMILRDFIDLPVLGAFEKACPDIRMHYSFKTAGVLVEELKKGRLDALIAPDVITLDPVFQRQNLGELPEMLVCGKGDLDAFGSLAKLVQERPLITKTADPAYLDTVNATLEKLCKSACVSMVSVETYNEQMFMVAHSQGFAIVPKQNLDDNLYRTWDLAGLYHEMCQVVSHPEHVSQALKAFLDFVSYHIV